MSSMGTGTFIYFFYAGTSSGPSVDYVQTRFVISLVLVWPWPMEARPSVDGINNHVQPRQPLWPHRKKRSSLTRPSYGIITMKIDQNTKIHENAIIEDSSDFEGIIIPLV